MRNYKQLTEKDRWELYHLYRSGVSLAAIARQLGRHRSTLHRELLRNQAQGEYLPGMAHKLSRDRKEKGYKSKIARYETLRRYIHDKLKLGWSPEQIAGRLKRKKSKYAICHETIYRYIYTHPDRRWYSYLKYKRKKRYKRCTRKKRACRFGEKRLITQRPSYIEKRYRWGHWEGDSIEFCGTKKVVVTTLVERKSRMVFLIKNEHKSASDVMNSIREKFESLPKLLRQTITLDQGNEFGSPHLLEKGLRCRVYYCHSHSPWEKGSNENMNGRLRRYLPRTTNIHLVTQEQLNEIAEKVNTTPRKCLGYRMPKELFSLKHYSICRT